MANVEDGPVSVGHSRISSSYGGCGLEFSAMHRLRRAVLGLGLEHNETQSRRQRLVHFCFWRRFYVAVP